MINQDGELIDWVQRQINTRVVGRGRIPDVLTVTGPRLQINSAPRFLSPAHKGAARVTKASGVRTVVRI